jgi:curved DNA-binding protein
MNDEEFVDFYELLELSPNANANTVERVFRYLAKKHHPDTSPGNDCEIFNNLVRAYETLRDPAKRAAYDAAYERQQDAKVQIIEGANAAGDDCVDRYKVLSVLYSKRRSNFKQPGIGMGTLEQLVGFPPGVLEFHLWYFREKEWVKREESGQFSISAGGVDHIESMNQPAVSDHLRLEHRPDALPQGQLLPS